MKVESGVRLFGPFHASTFIIRANLKKDLWSRMTTIRLRVRLLKLAHSSFQNAHSIQFQPSRSHPPRPGSRAFLCLLLVVLPAEHDGYGRRAEAAFAWDAVGDCHSAVSGNRSGEMGAPA